MHASPIVVAAVLLSARAIAASDPCAPLPPPAGPTVTVTPIQADQLRGVVASASTGTTILLADGVYDLGGGDAIHRLVFGTPGVTLRSASGDRDAVVLDGGYGTHELISVYASDVVIADLTLRRAYDHPVHVTGPGAPISGVVLHNLRIEDPGQQAVKINPDGSGAGTAHGGVVRCSEIVLTDAGRSQVRDDCYTGGIDAHAAASWHLHDLRIEGFWCPEGLSEHGVHFWRASADTLVERVAVLDCARGIGFGLGSSSADGHSGGIIRNCTVAAADPLLDASEYGFDTGVGLESAPGAAVLHVTVASAFAPRSSSVEWRWPSTSVEIANVLATDRLLPRDGATAILAGNLDHVPVSWFRSVASGDLHLVAGAGAAVDAGVALAPGRCDRDIDREPRDAAPDVGADEAVDAVFSDGFESADLTAWSDSVPGHLS